MTSKTPSGSVAGNRGFSLVEMLVTVLILSIGLLGLAGLQAMGLRNNMSAYQRTQASVLASDMLDRMRANRQVALAGSYDIVLTATAGGNGNAIAQNDISQWLANLSNLLPEGDGAIDCTSSNPVCVVTVRWNDNRGVKTANASFQSFQVSAEL